MNEYGTYGMSDASQVLPRQPHGEAP